MTSPRVPVSRDLRWVRGGTDADAVTELYDALVAGPVEARILLLAPDRAGFEHARARITQPLDDVDVIVRTSGTTDGQGRLVGLSRRALESSARATLAHLGGAGQWLTSLPTHAVAGLQVVVRSAIAGIPPVTFEGRGGFDAALFADRVAALRPDVPRYLSLVPTQLVRALEADASALTAFDAVLVGGAALPPHVAERARDAGVRVVTTYGMTETCGGCVYDGRPLAGVRVRLVEGRVHVGGATLATRYLDTPAQPFVSDDAGERWLVTNDIAEQVGDRLRVLGRADDVIISGGTNVHPAAVEAALASLGGTWVVVGVPDPEWGQRVVAVTDLAPPPTLDAVRAVTAHLGPAGRPRAVVALAAWPLRPTGKIDRRAVVAAVG